MFQFFGQNVSLNFYLYFDPYKLFLEFGTLRLVHPVHPGFQVIAFSPFGHYMTLILDSSVFNTSHSLVNYTVHACLKKWCFLDHVFLFERY